VTYRGRCERRRRHKLRLREAEVLAAREEERAAAKASHERALERRPYRVPTAAMLGFESERVWQPSESVFSDEYGERRVTVLGCAPTSLEVVVPVDLGTIRSPQLLSFERSPEALAYHETRHAHFVARPWRLRVADGNHVHWWNWEPKRGRHYSAAVTLLRHLRAARGYAVETVRAAEHELPDYMIRMSALRLVEVIERAIAGTSEWLGVEERA
jgi:hypothetical protein